MSEVPGEIGRIVVALGFLLAARRMSSIAQTRRERILLDDVLKRTADVVWSTALLLFVGPVLAAVAVLIRLGSVGPIFDREERAGLRGQRFLMYRFRTVEMGGGRITTPEQDRRSTRIGRFLRRTSLDVLPLLVNVLRGEMSFVGPRAKPVYLVAEVTRVIPGYSERAKVKPGITGWAQVRGSFDAQTELADDLYYVQNRSLKLDAIILLRTFKLAL